jgi:3-dehydroquinate dehydratase I
MPQVAPVTLRSVTLGAGRPAVCVPLVGTTLAALRDGVAALPPEATDLVELRIDFFEGVGDPAAVTDALAVVRDALPAALPLLFTFRTRAEGGQRALEPDAYSDLLEHAAASGLVDAIDVEQFTPRRQRERAIAAARAAGIPVVVSSHDFVATPDRDAIVERLVAQQDLGADIVKIAVMPGSARDVLTLLDATEEFRRRYATRPAITMAMGPLGVVSRLAGEVFGSCLTFGAVGSASAPGQVEAGRLRAVLDVVHDAQEGPSAQR